jgi:hypothetical protein
MFGHCHWKEEMSWPTGERLPWVLAACSLPSLFPLWEILEQLPSHGFLQCGIWLEMFQCVVRERGKAGISSQSHQASAFFPSPSCSVSIQKRQPMGIVTPSIHSQNQIKK